MKKITLLKIKTFYPTQILMASSLKVSQQSIQKWLYRGYFPVYRARQIEKITHKKILWTELCDPKIV